MQKPDACSAKVKPPSRCSSRAGCKTCASTGYRGRVALYEVMVLTDPIKDLVLQGASTAELKTEAIRLGMATLRRSGLNKINEGVTTLEEILRVTASD